ncbi:alpha/beta fold hydrolase [Streptomyces sp. NPDC006645]|uniref:alpha/beta fold hydrolase n=1 Tax=unclassified Streptomyces TaxID=2593676 RepID=UPI0033A98E63
MNKAVIVFIHGLFSSASTWDNLTNELSKLNGVREQFDIECFEYATPRFAWNPLRRMPDLNVVAENLRGFITDVAESHERIVLVTHSQGGLVVQRFLSRMLADGRAAELAKIRRLVMFACPNSGSELFLLSRRGLLSFTRNSQERELRPLQSSVVDAQRRVMHGVVQATELSHNKCPIPIVSYAGETDNVVAPASALSIFPNSAVLPGDHFSIIKPNSNGRLLSAMRRELSEGLMEPFPEKYSDDLPSRRRLPKDQDGGFLTEQELLGPISIRTAPGITTRFFVHGGPVEQLSNVDVVLSSENTYLQMSQFFKSSTSGSLRFASAIKGAGGEILEDVAGDHLVAWLRSHATYGLQVQEGTVVPTPAGALAAKNVHRIYHAAIVSPVSGTNNYTVNPLAVTRAVHNIFNLARREREELKVQLTSICIPLFGAGRGGININKSFDLIWDPLMSELSNDASWEIHFTTRRRQNFDQVYKLLQAKKDAEQL